MRLRAVCCTCLSLLATSAPDGANSRFSQRSASSSFSGSSATQPVSAATLATWLVRGNPDGSRELQLLVLWRGTPGWFLNDSGQSATSGGAASSFWTTLEYGGVSLRVEYLGDKQILRVQDAEVVLRDANVVLVDRVDDTGGPAVVGTLRIPSDLAPGTGRPDIEAELRRSPEILDFLQCGAQVPDGRGQAMFDLICARILGPLANGG